jgi:hypothetical protein
MAASGSVEGIVGEILTEIQEIEDQIDGAPETAGLAPGEKLQFQPLTDEEKKKFESSLDAKARQILAELAGKTTSAKSPDSDPAPFATLEVSSKA